MKFMSRGHGKKTEGDGRRVDDGQKKGVVCD